RRLRAEIRLVNLPILIDDERHDAGIAVLCRIRDDGESADRPSLYDIVERAGFGALSLTLQHPVVVAVEGRRLLVALLVALAGRVRYEHAEGAVRLARLCGPIQAVALPWAARKFLRVVEHAVAVAILGCVLTLRVDDRLQNLHCIEFFLADAAGQKLIFAGLGVEAPALAGLHDREREG